MYIKVEFMCVCIYVFPRTKAGLVLPLIQTDSEVQMMK